MAVEQGEMEFYVYYRVKDSDAAMLQARVMEMQAALATAGRILATVKRRPEISNGVQTWMEIYAAAPADFEVLLDKAVLQFGLAELIEGRRHVERFMDIGSCV